jgi:hypothetical protein
MTPINYVNIVIGTLNLDIQEKVLHCLQNKNEAQAEEILLNLHLVIYPTSKLRYRFAPPSKQDQLIKTIFDFAIKKAPNIVLQAAETPTYPLWKRAVWIKVPQALGYTLKNTFFKLIISIAVMHTLIPVGYTAYGVTTNFLNARAIPLIINNTPIKIIRSANFAMTSLENAYKRQWEVLAFVLIGRWIIMKMPEIPYLTAFARVVNPFIIFQIIWMGPMTVGNFIGTTCYDISKFGWNSCTNVGLFLIDSAEKSDAERIACAKPQAYTLWVESLQKIALAGT